MVLSTSAQSGRFRGCSDCWSQSELHCIQSSAQPNPSGGQGELWILRAHGSPCGTEPSCNRLFLDANDFKIFLSELSELKSLNITSKTDEGSHWEALSFICVFYSRNDPSEKHYQTHDF